MSNTIQFREIKNFLVTNYISKLTYRFLLALLHFGRRISSSNTKCMQRILKSLDQLGKTYEVIAVSY